MKKTGSSNNGWLRSVNGGNDYNVMNVNSDGSYNNNNAYNTSNGVSPGFYWRAGLSFFLSLQS